MGIDNQIYHFMIKILVMLFPHNSDHIINLFDIPQHHVKTIYNPDHNDIIQYIRYASIKDMIKSTFQTTDIFMFYKDHDDELLILIKDGGYLAISQNNHGYKTCVVVKVGLTADQIHKMMV